MTATTSSSPGNADRLPRPEVNTFMPLRSEQGITSRTEGSGDAREDRISLRCPRQHLREPRPPPPQDVRGRRVGGNPGTEQGGEKVRAHRITFMVWPILLAMRWHTSSNAIRRLDSVYWKSGPA